MDFVPIHDSKHIQKQNDEILRKKRLQEEEAMIKGSLGGETSVLRTFRMSGKELVKERVSEGKSLLGKELIVTFRLSGKGVSQRKS
jgi:hypothetical protein